MQIVKKALIVLAILAVAFIASWKVQEYCVFSRYTHPTEKVDTLLIRDTIVRYEPILREIVRKETIYIPADTIRVHDTLMVAVEKEQVVWQDSLARIYVSGVMPSVDSVFHYNTRQIITREVQVPTKVRTPWGLGVQIGYGVGVANKQVVGVPYVGVGISYNLLSW